MSICLQESDLIDNIDSCDTCIHDHWLLTDSDPVCFTECHNGYLYNVHLDT